MVALQSAGAVTKGEERVLVALATAGSRPYSVAEVESTVRQVGAFFRTSSFGQVRLQIDVTPWLAAFNSNPGCGGLTSMSFEALVAPAREAAVRAGFNADHYDDAVYAIADSHCAFFGETWGREVMLTRQPTLQLLAHELGHTFGPGHARLAPGATARDRAEALHPGSSDVQDEIAPGPRRRRDGWVLVDRVPGATVPRTRDSVRRPAADQVPLRAAERADRKADEGEAALDRSARVLSDP